MSPVRKSANNGGNDIHPAHKFYVRDYAISSASLLYMSGITTLYAWHHYSICPASLLYMPNITTLYVWHHYSICPASLLYMSGSTTLYVRQHYSICLASLLYMPNIITLYVRHHYSICLASLLYMSGITTLYAWHHYSICLASLLYTSGITIGGLLPTLARRVFSNNSLFINELGKETCLTHLFVRKKSLPAGGRVPCTLRSQNNQRSRYALINPGKVLHPGWARSAA